MSKVVCAFSVFLFLVCAVLSSHDAQAAEQTDNKYVKYTESGIKVEYRGMTLSPKRVLTINYLMTTPTDMNVTINGSRFPIYDNKGNEFWGRHSMQIANTNGAGKMTRKIPANTATPVVIRYMTNYSDGELPKEFPSISLGVDEETIKFENVPPKAK